MKALKLLSGLIIISSLFTSMEVQASNDKKSGFAFRPPNKGAPANSVGGAVRGNVCAVDREKDAELKTYTSNSSLTAKSHPQIIVYVPELDANKQAFLIVKDQEENYYQEQSLTIPADGGKIVLALDSDRPSLESGTTYEYFLRIQCNAQARPSDPIIKGSIERVADRITIPADISLEQQLEMLAQKQLWYDALYVAHQLAEQGDSSYWKALIDSVSN